jgi:hypothetical protein
LKNLERLRMTMPRMIRSYFWQTFFCSWFEVLCVFKG